MTAVMVQSLFPVFHDAQGKPLDGGYVYIGMIGVNPETHPVPVYWDAARTIPAAQPIRTIAGFPSRNGSPAAIFTDGDVSVTLRDAGRALVWSALDGQTAQAGFMGQEPVYFFSGSGTSAPIVLPVQVSGPEYLRVFVNGNWLRPGIDFTASGYDLAPAGDFDAWPVGVNNISVSLYRQVSLANITTDDVSYDGGTVTDALDTLLPENVIRLSDYMHPTDLAAAIAGNTAAQDGSRVTASAQAWLDACLAATLAQDGANIIGFADAGIYRTNNRLMTDAFNNMNWSTGGFSRSRLRLRTDGSVRFRLQNWAGGRAALRTDGPYAGSTYIAPIAVFEWFQNTGHQRFGGFEGQWIIEGQDNPNTDPMGFYLYRLNAATFNGELEVTNLRNRNFVWDSIFNTHADYVRSTGSAGVMLTEAGGSGLLAADTTSTVAGVTQRTGLRYTLSGATITINTMVRNETTGTVESSTPASVFTSDHVGKWIGLDRQGRENTIGDNPDDPAEGGSTRRSVRWFQIASVTDASTAVLAVAPSQQGTTGQMVQQNRTFSFEVLKCSVTAGSNTATLSMPVTTSLVGLEVTIPGAHYDGLPARRPHLCAMVTAHSGNTVTLSHAAGVTRSGVPFVVAPQVTIGSLSHTEFLSSSRNCDDFHIARVWCESGQTAAVPLFVQDATNVTIGDESKLHGCPSTNNVNFGANFTCVLAGDFGVRFKGRFTHSRHSREFGMFYIGGDRSEAWIDGELSSWTADDQTAIFYIDPANVASTRIWDVYFNASDYATGFPDASAGQVFERGGPNYTPGRVKAGASQRSPRGERPLWPPVTLPPSRAPWWGSTRADAVSALARGGVVPENGVIYTIGGLEYLGQTGATAIADLPGLTWAGERDIRHFGAESGAADVRAAFVAARDSVPAGQAGKVIVPPGVWNISTSLTANNNNFVEWEIQDGASVLPSVGARISGSTWRINYPRSGAVDRAEIRDKPVVADGNAIGRYDIITNTGGLNETGYGERIGYTSSAYGSGRFDIATAVISQFNRTAGNGGGQSLAQWLVTVSPTTGDGTSGNAWGSFVAEWNIVNRGQDTGFTDRRSNLQNWTGGVQMVIEDDLLGIDPAITKNVTFGFMFAGQTPTGNDVDRRRYYAGILGEPNCIAGLTGRALYWTGDTTGQTNRIPLAFLEGAGRWGHGLKLDAGTFDTAAIQMAHGHSIRWGASGTPVTVTGQNGSVEVSGEGFAAAWGSTRSTAVAAIAGGLWTPVNGRTYTIGGLRYRGVTGSTNIPDMPGLVPVAPYHVDQMGVTGDGVTDDYARIQALITYVGQNGGGLITFGAAQYGLSAQLVVEHSGVFLEGQGAAAYRPPPSEAGILASARTSFVPLVGFPAGDAAVLFRTPAGAQRCIGGGMRGIHIAGYARCAAGLRIVTWEHGEFDRLSIYGATVANLDLDVTTTATLATGAIYDTQWNRFSNIYCNNVNKPASDSANALRTNAFENVGGVNPDPVPASIGNPNVSYNSFDNCQFISNSVAAANLIGATDNLFTNCQALVNNDLDQITTQGWSLTSADQDTRLNATVTKRNRFEKCNGRFHARASQAGRASSYLNVIDGHMTHTRSIFRVPVVFEAPSGGALPADLLLSNDFGDLYQRRLIGEYTDIEKRRSFMDVAVSTINVNMIGGGTAITVAGAIPDGAVVLGVTTRVTTFLNGAAGYQVGTVADPDRFGQVTGFAVGTRTGNADWTVGTIELFTSATDIVITSTTGVFNAGVIALCVYYARAISEHS